MTMQVSGTSGFTFPDNTTQATAAKVGMTNRIINGAMVIDQRNAGASVTQANGRLYVTDRFAIDGSVASKFTGQQVSVGLVGFPKALKITSSAATSVGSSDYYYAQQNIEGLNVADLAWGTASAAPVTLSFWVYSSLTGTFGGALRNALNNRSYPFTYVISAANTWEQKTITIAGDTSGTWAVDNTTGIGLNFGLGLGSTYSGTAGSWAGANYLSATGATSVVGTSGATFYITGVQLEKGSTATSFDYRPYGTELALCQRYFEKSYATATAVGANTAVGSSGYSGSSDGNSNFNCPLVFKVEKRDIPTIIAYTASGTSGSWSYTRSGVGATNTTTNGYAPSTASTTMYGSVGAAWSAVQVGGQYTISAEL